ncbi:hypothetical protein BUH_7111 [Burkholderia pseudomallei Pakistan 9]|nr:hypothetical protein BUH_7111 [Burkholderia pseudomallei Pakistan 9]
MNSSARASQMKKCVLLFNKKNLLLENISPIFSEIEYFSESVKFDMKFCEVRHREHCYGVAKRLRACMTSPGKPTLFDPLDALMTIVVSAI